jgi:hypothetical protein
VTNKEEWENDAVEAASSSDRPQCFDTVRLRCDIGDHPAGSAGIICDARGAPQGWVIVELVDEIGRTLGVRDFELDDLEIVERAPDKHSG